jgi:cell volume regulation protein A
MTLEVESGLNDPMAVILTVQLTKVLVTGEPLGWRIGLEIVVELTVGAVVGWLVGRFGAWLLRKARLSAGGLYPVLTVALAFLAFGASTLVHGSGFLAVYVAAVIVGNAQIPYRGGIARVHDAIAWFSQVGMFLMLGLLSDPLRLTQVWGIGLVLGLALTFLARPLSVLACLAPFRYAWRERFSIAWLGLRGPVPIILATYPVMAKAPGASLMFDVVFFIVVVSAILPGATVKWVTKKAGLASTAAPPAPALLEVTSTRLLHGNVIAFFVDRASAVSGVQIADLPFPAGAAVMLIVRQDELVAPRGQVVLLPGDHIYVITRPEDEPLVNLMFGKREEID